MYLYISNLTQEMFILNSNYGRCFVSILNLSQVLENCDFKHRWKQTLHK